MHRTFPNFAAVLLLAGVAACADAPPEADPASDQMDEAQSPAVGEAPEPRELEYDPELGVDFERLERTASGLYMEDLAEGDGPPAEAGDMVEAHYTGSLPDGTVFDTSRDGDPISFPLGMGVVIPGWDEGLEGMRVGGRRLLVIPPELAYGPEGAGDGVIPPNATLVFDVELVGLP